MCSFHGLKTSQGAPEREFFVDNLVVRIYFIIVMIRWTGLAPWEFEFPFPTHLISKALQVLEALGRQRCRHCLRSPHGGLRTVHQKSTCLTQLTLWPNLVTFRSNFTWSARRCKSSRHARLLADSEAATVSGPLRPEKSGGKPS